MPKRAREHLSRPFKNNIERRFTMKTPRLLKRPGPDRVSAAWFFESAWPWVALASATMELSCATRCLSIDGADDAFGDIGTIFIA